jgi:hypothetical protein
VAGGTAALLVPANPDRRQGIHFFNTSLTAGSFMTLGTASPATAFDGLPVYDPSSATTTVGMRNLFVPGTGALYGRARNGYPNTWSAQEI